MGRNPHPSTWLEGGLGVALPLKRLMVFSLVRFQGHTKSEQQTYILVVELAGDPIPDTAPTPHPRQLPFPAEAARLQARVGGVVVQKPLGVGLPPQFAALFHRDQINLARGVRSHGGPNAEGARPVGVSGVIESA